MIIQNLTCEYNANPLAIGIQHPRLGWQLALESSDSQERNKRQTAYRIIVASDTTKLDNLDGDCWDSGKVISEHSYHISYNGQELVSRREYFWRVQVWDENDQVTAWSSTASWTMGPLSQNDWDKYSSWIGVWDTLSYEDRFPITSELEDVHPSFRKIARQMHPDAGPDPENKKAMGIYLRKDFNISSPTSIKKAILRVTGLGYYEAYLNGQKIGDHVLDPGATDYTKRIYYIAYDVTSFLSNSNNCIGILLGGGWYSVGTPDLFGFDKAPWNAPPRCRAEIEIIDQLGKSQFIGTDSTWIYCIEGPIRFNCIRSGEIYDARKEIPQWSHYKGIEGNSSIWFPSVLVSSPQGILVPQLCPPIKVERSILPDKRTEPTPGIFVFHFPENCTGWVQIQIRGKPGQILTIKLNERLLDSGRVDMEINSGHTYGRFQTCNYICHGNGIEIWHPRFSYQGFQYVEIEGLLSTDDFKIEAQMVHSAISKTGEFKCSNKLINQIDDISRRTFLNGYHSYPEDCAQREKAGWTEDAAISAQGSVYNFNCLTIYEKWIHDLQDSQHKSGQIPVIVLCPGWGKPKDDNPTDPGHMADPWWSGALILMPWKLYCHYGDQSIIEKTYPFIQKYMQFLDDYSNPDGLIRWNTLLGEWLEVGSNGSANRTPRVLTANQAYHYYAILASKMAAILNRPQDQQKYIKLAEEIATTLNKEFLDPATGLYCPDSQSAPAIALFTGLAPSELKTLISKELIQNVVDVRKGHLSTGIVATYFLYQALAQIGHPEIAYQVITAKGYPGFEYMLNKETSTWRKATTLWEDWQGNSSWAHPVQGCVVSYFYEWLAGIQPMEAHPGFKEFILNPQFISDLDFVDAKIQTVYGEIKSCWKRNGSEIQWEITVPINSVAHIQVPQVSEKTLGSGNYQFSFKL